MPPHTFRDAVCALTHCAAPPTRRSRTRRPRRPPRCSRRSSRASPRSGRARCRSLSAWRTCSRASRATARCPSPPSHRCPTRCQARARAPAPWSAGAATGAMRAARRRAGGAAPAAPRAAPHRLRRARRRAGMLERSGAPPLSDGPPAPRALARAVIAVAWRWSAGGVAGAARSALCGHFRTIVGQLGSECWQCSDGLFCVLLCVRAGRLPTADSWPCTVGYVLVGCVLEGLGRSGTVLQRTSVLAWGPFVWVEVFLRACG